MTKIPKAWPVFKQNALFRADFDRAAYNACVGNNGGPYDLYDYAHGYFEATELLLKAVGKDHGLTNDLLVYPICLNFRHAIELFIKYLISDLSKLTKSHAKFKPTHSLEENWGVAKELTKKTKLNVDPKEVAWLTQVVSDVMEVDPNGNIFRYPESIKGDQHLKDWALINLAVVGDVFLQTLATAERWHGKIEDRIEDAIER
jgi:hypothetical protein